MPDHDRILAEAREFDALDPLPSRRDLFHLPCREDGSSLLYLASHSLGLQPRDAGRWVQRELDRWAALGVEGHFDGDPPWYTYLRPLREPLGRLLGARPDEVVIMNGLTVNLHLLLASFFLPTPARHAILVDAPTFPSDRYALLSQIRHHGHDPADALLSWSPRPGEDLLRTEDFADLLARHGHRVAVVLLNAVNFLTGQRLDLPRLTELAHAHGCLVGLDLAHAAGNVPLRLHDWVVDFAVGCTYKYLCGGPGSPGLAFVHERHGLNAALPRLAGWWGNPPDTRFRMQIEPEFVPQPGADGWQVSNPPVLAVAPLHAAFARFDEVGIDALRSKSRRLTGFLESALQPLVPGKLTLLTPADPEQRGCQLSLRIPGHGKELLLALRREGVVADFREPDVIRVAPVPLVNTFEDVARFAVILGRLLQE